ncbi:MAG: MGMT family protein [Elusimicrobia bacterium]|nr:MGMT family protein [Elusimicrobiota bacterium]
MPLPKRILAQFPKYPPFYQAVWKACADIPRGATLTYGALARKLGKPGAARAVGQALGANPFAPVVPCHRVVAASGLGGFSAKGGRAAKRRLLEREGAL